MGNIFRITSFLVFIIIKNNGIAGSLNEIKSFTNELGFIENKGQLTDFNNQPRSDILYVAKNPGGNVFIRKTGLSYVFVKPNESAENEHHKTSNTSFVDWEIEKINLLTTKKQSVTYLRTDLEFTGNLGAYTITNKAPSIEYFNYYFSHSNEGITNVRAYNEVTLNNYYDNIDLVYYFKNSNSIKYDFVVYPGASVSQIGMKYSGCDNIIIEEGKIKVILPFGEIQEMIPDVYQNINGKIVHINAWYEIKNSEIKIKTANYNKNFKLIIDPWVTYFGGAQVDKGNDINTDGAGNILFCGYTYSNNFPVTTGAFQTNYSAGTDAFVSKFNNQGNRIWTTYFGGSLNDMANALDIDAANNIYFTGSTQSTNFPVSVSAFQTTKAAGSDAFIAKLNSSGNLQWSTYYGATGNESSMAIDADASGDIAIAGVLYGSSTLTTPSCYQAVSNAGAEIFVLKFTSNGTRLWATHYGGTNDDIVFDIDTDSNNDIIFTGHSKSNNYPIMAAFQPLMPSTSQNAVITKLNGSNGFPIWSTYYGSPNGDYGGIGIAIDAFNNIYMTGTSGTGFPTTMGSFMFNAAGQSETYLVKFNSAGTRQWATFVGGTMGEEAWDVVVDDKNDVYVCGDTYSRDFPTTPCAFSTSMDMGNCCGGGEDAYLTKFDPNGLLLCSGYFGGIGHDENFIMAEYNGMVYLMANTASGAPITPGAFQTSKAGLGDDIMLAQLCGYTCGLINLQTDFSSSQTNACKGSPINFNCTYTTCDTSQTKWLWSFNGATPNTSTQKNPTNIMYNISGVYDVKLILITPCDTDTVIKTGYINVYQPTTQINSVVNAACNTNNGSINITTSGGYGNYTYNWLPGNMSTSSISNLAAGTYSLFVTDDLGCTTTSIATISQPSAPSLTLTSTNATCNGINNGQINSSVTGGSLPYIYSWSNGQTGSTALLLSAGNYTCIVTDSNGCSTTSTTNITEPLPININISSPPILCSGQATSISASVQGGTPGYSYSWSTSQTTSTISVTPTTSTNYILTVIDGNGCSNTLGANVVVHPPSIITYSNTIKEGCSPLCVSFSNTTNNSVAQFWNFSNNISSSNQNAINCFTNPGNYSFSLTVIDSNGCSNTLTQNNFILIHPNPIAAFTPLPPVTTLLNPTINFINQSNGANAWLWSFGDVNHGNSTSYHTNYTYSDTGKFEVTLIVYNEFGCSDTAKYTITIEADYVIYIPNSFTPNNDGLNDVFIATGTGIKNEDFEFYIFDRWGNLIFQSQNASEGWNGKANNGNEIAQEDTYVWLIKTKDLSGQKHRYVGHVNLLR